MIRELRIHDSHDEATFSAVGGSRRSTPLMCPNCQEPIPLSSGLCGNRQIDAILLQAERIGAELDCQRCGLRFVYHRVNSGMGQHLIALNPERSQHVPLLSQEKDVSASSILVARPISS